jgi:EAL domain-containing protein (putative c-di-GMP-specific phosphodiesterase class I)
MIEDRLVGAEALLRWQHPQWGNVSPAVFIPLAEQSGVITQIGAWVFEQVAIQVAQWRQAGFRELVVAVNVSAVQFAQPAFVDEAIAAIRRADIPAHAIEIELTEAVALRHPEAAAQKIEQLHREGFRIAIDDFGTGYSSMGYLKRLSLDKIKIDQSFIRDLTSDDDDKAIVTAIVQMAHSLGMGTIAEGVETEAQANFLRIKGCDAIQGYWYSHPLSEGEFEVLLDRSH